jgi:ribonuclease/clavin/mitogillin
MSRLIDAVSVVLKCEHEILIIKRQNHLKAFPGYSAFPGGKVDKNDLASNILNDQYPSMDRRLLGAVERELKEELSLDFEELIRAKEILDFKLLDLAITPDFNPVRFSTYFYLVELKNKPNLIFDKGEVFEGNWALGKNHLSDYEMGKMLAVPPVINIIKYFALEDYSQKISLQFSYDNSVHVPMIESMKGLRQAMPLSNTLPPAERTNAFIIGDIGSNVILFDPSPKDRTELNKLLSTIEPFKVTHLLISHHHPDHHEYSTDIARLLKLPVFISQDSFNRLTQINPKYFDQLDVLIVKEGTVVTKWLGQDVLVFEVPGHDEGQIALAPKKLNWFIAGDLFQGAGTVVVGGAGSSMKKYLESLRKVIALNPKVVLPSHGIGLGGVDILVKTLEHRLMREEQVFKLQSEGRSVIEMLDIIYTDLPDNLKPYAKANIDSHLFKLKEEGRI